MSSVPSPSARSDWSPRITYLHPNSSSHLRPSLLEPETSSPLVRLEQQRELRPALWIIPQNRPLHHRRLFADLADRHGKLEFERAYECEEERFNSATWDNSSRAQCQIDAHLGRQLDSLDEGEAVSDACSGAAKEGQKVAPHTRNLRDGLRNILPPFWPTVGGGTRVIG